MPIEDGVPRIDRPSRLSHTSASEVSRGNLVLIGGACTPDGHALGSFLDLTGARDGARIVGITAASGEAEESARYWRTAFRSVGARNIEIPAFDRETERDEAVAASIADAAGVFLGGGDQVRLVTELSGTKTGAAIRDLFTRGGTVCGTSAGAAALSRLTMAGGEIDEEGNLIEQYIGPGLGLLGFDAIIDTHFSQRRRLQRLFLVVASNTELFGLGIDENTALVVHDGVGEVVGAGAVMFVDGRDSVRFDNVGDLEHGRQLTLSHLRVGIVGTRYHLDLRARDLRELVTREPSSYLREAAADWGGR